MTTESAVKHIRTPGPWHVHDGDNRFLFIDSETEGSVCKIAVNPHSEANARLIAAAPALLEALEWAMRHVSRRGTETYENNVHKAEAAIRAAKGLGLGNVLAKEGQ